MTLTYLMHGLKKYVAGYYSYAQGIEGMNAWAFVADGLWCRLRYGCVFNQFTEGGFFRHRAYQRRRILTYRHWKRIIRANSPADVHVFRNKADFNTFYHRFVGREWLRSATMSEAEFAAFAGRHAEAIVKPLADWEGNGIRFEKITPPGTDETRFREQFAALKAHDVLIEEIVVQHPHMVFGNRSVNTIRAYTVYDAAERQAHLICTTLRAGVGEAVVDNSHSGGLAYEVDIATGRIDSCGWSHTRTGQMFHPGTGICMLGRAIPHWEAVKSLVVRAAEMMPSVPYVGWDVAILPDGPILIEGNHDPDLDIMEFVGRSGYLPAILQHLKH